MFCYLSLVFFAFWVSGTNFVRSFFGNEFNTLTKVTIYFTISNVTCLFWHSCNAIVVMKKRKALLTASLGAVGCYWFVSIYVLMNCSTLAFIVARMSAREGTLSRLGSPILWMN